MTNGEALLMMFRRGHDTKDISIKVSQPEWLVSRLIWTARCKEKQKPALFVTAQGIQRSAIREE